MPWTFVYFQSSCCRKLMNIVWKSDLRIYLEKARCFETFRFQVSIKIKKEEQIWVENVCWGFSESTFLINSFQIKERKSEMWGHEAVSNQLTCVKNDKPDQYPLSLTLLHSPLTQQTYSNIISSHLSRLYSPSLRIRIEEFHYIDQFASHLLK